MKNSDRLDRIICSLVITSILFILGCVLLFICWFLITNFEKLGAIILTVFAFIVVAIWVYSSLGKGK